MEEMPRARCGEGRGAPMLSEHHSPQICTCSPTQKLSRPCPFEFLQRIHYTGTIDQITGHWRLIQPAALLTCPDIRGGTRSSNPLTTWLVPLATSPHPLEKRFFPKSHLIHLTRDTVIALPTQEVPRVLGTLCQDQGTKTENLFLITNHKITVTQNFIDNLALELKKLFQKLIGSFYFF